MSKNQVIDVVSRSETGKNVSRRLRRDGSIPAVLYGMKRPAVSLVVDPGAIQSILHSESGDNTLFQLRLDGTESKTRHVMIRERQKDPVTGSLVHVDFVRIDLQQKVDVEVPVQILGIAAGVKDDGGVLDFIVRTVELRCLPQDIPEHLDVDVTKMNIGQVFRVKDLTDDSRFEVQADPEQPIVVISAPTAEEEEEVAAPEGEAEAAPEDADAADAGAVSEENKEPIAADRASFRPDRREVAIVFVEPTLKAVLGLGNPGPGYRLTRHNLGFLVVERLAQRHRVHLEGETRVRTGRWRYGGGGRRIWLGCPMTYMNRSGRAATWLRAEEGIDPGELLVVVDDLDLPFGVIRIRGKGGGGTHNGMRSLVEAIGEDFPRLRLGIGPAPDRVDVADWVLSEFSKVERDNLDPFLDGAADCVETAVRLGVRAAMNRHNGTSPTGD